MLITRARTLDTSAKWESLHGARDPSKVRRDPSPITSPPKFSPRPSAILPLCRPRLFCNVSSRVFLFSHCYCSPFSHLRHRYFPRRGATCRGSSETFKRARLTGSAVFRGVARGFARHIRSVTTMDESGIDMGFDLTAALAVADPNAHHAAIGDYDDFEQTLSLLSSSTKDLMYYELKSRAPDTGRYVILVPMIIFQ